MGRKKIPIKRITEERNRQVTFAKRKNGLLKKAMELSILCDAEIAVIIFSTTNNQTRLHNYCSTNITNTLTKLAHFEGTVESRDNTNFNAPVPQVTQTSAIDDPTAPITRAAALAALATTRRVHLDSAVTTNGPHGIRIPIPPPHHHSILPHVPTMPHHRSAASAAGHAAAAQAAAARVAVPGAVQAHNGHGLVTTVGADDTDEDVEEDDSDKDADNNPHASSVPLSLPGASSQHQKQNSLVLNPTSTTAAVTSALPSGGAATGPSPMDTSVYCPVGGRNSSGPLSASQTKAEPAIASSTKQEPTTHPPRPAIPSSIHPSLSSRPEPMHPPSQPSPRPMQSPRGLPGPMEFVSPRGSLPGRGGLLPSPRQVLGSCMPSRLPSSPGKQPAPLPTVSNQQPPRRPRPDRPPDIPPKCPNSNGKEGWRPKGLRVEIPVKNSDVIAPSPSNSRRAAVSSNVLSIPSAGVMSPHSGRWVFGPTTPSQQPQLTSFVGRQGTGTTPASEAFPTILGTPHNGDLPNDPLVTPRNATGPMSAVGAFAFPSPTGSAIAGGLSRAIPNGLSTPTGQTTPTGLPTPTGAQSAIGGALGKRASPESLDAMEPVRGPPSARPRIGESF